VSTATRSRSTVAPLEQRLGREAEVHDWLHEIRNDVLSGRPANEVATIFREFRSNPVSDWWDGIPRCESGRGFVDRVTAGFDATFGALGARAVDQDGARRWTGVPEGRLVIVSHGGTSGVLIAHLLGMDQVPWPWERFGLLHASFARLEARPTAGAFAFGLTEFREIRHLTASLVTR
jgi:broad specificity phosphatase PhoE